MELWELIARESIRDLVARYNANGDSGRLEQVLEVFSHDATMEVVSPEETRHFHGPNDIATLFSDIRASWNSLARERSSPHYVRHVAGTHQIDLIDQSHATGRCYFFVIMPHGLDHWGRYLDTYEVREEHWLITHRRVLTDGRIDRGFTS